MFPDSVLSKGYVFCNYKTTHFSRSVHLLASLSNVLHQVDVVAFVVRRLCRSWTAPHQDRIRLINTHMRAHQHHHQVLRDFLGTVPSLPSPCKGVFDKQDFKYLEFQKVSKPHRKVVSSVRVR